MLNADAWARLGELFHQATELPESERTTFVHAHAGDDPELQRELLALIAADTDATRRLRDPLQHAAEATLRASDPELPPGTRFGPWALERVIGSGGMGRVYLARRADGAYEREVALKRVRTPALDARRHGHFEYECRLLAQMQHPAIAQIHDAGIEPDGHAWLVMEYIRGQPISTWCDQHASSLRQRVELLVKAGEGVQHAHQKGVIHRDLKPGNVLVGNVDGQPLPKIIDFGIAVETDAEGEVSGGGTPGYMSPEQARAGSEADARSDVYSLGAMLHELACGMRPQAGTVLAPSQCLQALPAQKQRELAARRATTPRVLRRELCDGVDAIVLKAMQAECSARYESVSSLLDDLRRWLAHYPPRAAGRVRWLAARKFVRRNRLVVSATGVVAAALVAGLLVTSWSLRQARQEAARAKVTSDFLASVLDSVDPAISQDLDKTLMLRVLDDASKRAGRELAAWPDIQADVELLIGINQTQLAAFEPAIAHLQVVRTLAGKHPGLLEFQYLRATQVLGDALVGAGELQEANALLAEGIERARSGDPEHLWLAYDMQSRLAMVLSDLGRPDAALREAREAEAGQARLLPADDQFRLDAKKRLANILSSTGDQLQAIALLRDILQRRTHLKGAEDPLTLVTRRDLAVAYLYQRDFAAAEAQLRPVVDAYERLYGEDNGYTAGARGLLAGALRQQGKVEASGPHYRAAMEWSRIHSGPEAPDTIVARHNHANWLLAAGHAEESEREQRALLEIADRVFSRNHPVTAEILRGLAEAELALGHVADAHLHASAALQAMREVYGDDRGDPLRSVRETLENVEKARRKNDAPRQREHR
ncbi:protein kinase [Stenotrophomonas sp. NLF4-10]|uniref:protein kinase domain-containing protein n=1 Tax=Stenotrophomonas sp. NLF4-10 TaxID=2918754 RepID=UPI001EFAEF0D|nr:protein kinase [Stenotrophomonas sp. NLF4-10]MCG8275234.1 serine/threonine-protein kinase [Stenotrophomonas sp. NLF4-10]